MGHIISYGIGSCTCPIGCRYGVSYRSAPALQIRPIPTTSSVFPPSKPFVFENIYRLFIIRSIKGQNILSTLFLGSIQIFFRKKRPLERRRTVKVTVRLLCVTCSVLRWKKYLLTFCPRLTIHIYKYKLPSVRVPVRGVWSGVVWCREEEEEKNRPCCCCDGG